MPQRWKTRFAGVAFALVLIRMCHADEALDKANELRLTGRYEKAIEAYQALPEQFHAQAARGIARCQWETGELDDAVKTIEGALKKLPGNARLHAERANLAFQRGDYRTAQTHVDKSLAANASQLLARWIVAELHRARGRLKEAEAGYEWFIDYYNATNEFDDAEALHLIGLAAIQYARWNRNSGQFRFVVNDLFPDARKLTDNYWPVRVESARLFLEKYNESDAADELESALETNPNAAEIYAAQARLALQEYDLPTARRKLDRAEEINPRLLEAKQLRADWLIADFQLKEAKEALEAALPLNPVSEETLGRLAAVEGALEGLPDPSVADASRPVKMQSIIDAAEKRNPRAGAFFAALGETLELMRRYPQSATYYAKATERMPQLVGPRGRQGLVHMRLGQEDRARPLLEASFEVDPFNERVRNQIDVLSVLDQYATIETDHFIVRYDRRHDELLGRYAADYLENEVYPEITEKFGYKPVGKSLFEIFNEAEGKRGRTRGGHDWFAIRMVGMPYLDTVGACAGRVVAIASPDAMPEKFNWAQVLKHEFVHVVNLQQTDFNVPHWFTEALAVMSEGYPRPSAWNEVLTAAHRDGELLTLDTINLAFVRPRGHGQWTLAYCQAELYAEHIQHRFGDDALAKMLGGYAENRSTAEIFDREFGVSLEELESGYREHVDKIVADLSSGAKEKTKQKTPAEIKSAYDESPDDPNAMADYACLQLKVGANPEAGRLARRTLELSPRHPLASYVRARLFLSIGEDETAEQLLLDAHDEMDPHEQVLGLLAGLRYKEEDFEEAVRLYELGAKHFPNDDKWRTALVRGYEKLGRSDQLAEAMERTVWLDADDAQTPRKLAELALDRKDYAAAIDWANRTLHVDVTDAEVHALLADALLGQGLTAKAIREYEVAIELAPERLEWKFTLANAFVRVREVEKARQLVEELLREDSDYPGAKELLQRIEN
jgi:tetratricopeptide (TPR) repeat protein